MYSNHELIYRHARMLLSGMQSSLCPKKTWIPICAGMTVRLNQLLNDYIRQYVMESDGKEHGMSESGLQALVENEVLLRALVGRRVNYLGKSYQLIDVLLDDDLLILSADEGADVQEDSYGRAHRLVPHQQNLRFRDAEGKPTHVWEEIAFLDGPMLA